MEVLELLLIMWPMHKGVINIYEPHLRSVLIMDSRTFCSSVSMTRLATIDWQNRLATIGDREKPMVKLTCSINVSWNWKYVDRRHNFARSHMSETLIQVLFPRESSCERSVEMICSAPSIGTLVNKLTTSKLIICQYS